MIGASVNGPRALKAGVPSATLPSPPSGGRWALSRIIQEAGGGFTTAAMAQGLASQIHAHYPPLNATKTGYTQTHALVRLLGAVGTPNADTDLLPDLALDASLGAQAASVQALLESRCPRYRYIDWAKAVVGKPLIPVSYTSGTLCAQVLADLWRHYEHSTSRPRPALGEVHNTEYTDDFGTDPTTRWTVEVGAWAWDSTDLEMDVNVSTDGLFRYSANSPGSIEHEAQVTAIGSSANNRLMGAATRVDNAGANDGYLSWIHGAAVNLDRMVAGVRTTLTTGTPVTYTSGDWYSLRLSAEGGNGANVVLNFWITDHNATKPADPGWVGVVGTPDITYTDTDVARLDDSTLNLQGGIGGRQSDTSEFDTRHDFFKVRAISDRAGGGGTILRTVNAYYYGGPS